MKAVKTVTVTVFAPERVGPDNELPRLLLKAPDERHPLPYADFVIMMMRENKPMQNAWVTAFLNHSTTEERELTGGTTDDEGGLMFTVEIPSPETDRVTLTCDHAPVAVYGFAYDVPTNDVNFDDEEFPDETTRRTGALAYLINELPELPAPRMPARGPLVIVRPSLLMDAVSDAAPAAMVSDPEMVTEVDAPELIPSDEVPYAPAAEDSVADNAPEARLEELSSSRLVVEPLPGDPDRPLYEMLGNGATLQQKLLAMLRHSKGSRCLVHEVIAILQNALGAMENGGLSVETKSLMGSMVEALKHSLSVMECDESQAKQQIARVPQLAAIRSRTKAARTRRRKPRRSSVAKTIVFVVASAVTIAGLIWTLS